MDFTKIRNYLFLGLLGVVTFAFLAIMQPFAYALFWAAVIAALFYPFYKRLNGFLKHQSLSAAVTLIAVIICAVVPLIILGVLLTRESVSLYNAANENGGLSSGLSHLVDLVKHNSITSGLNIDESFWTTKVAEISKSISDFIFSTLTNLTQNSLQFFVMFVLMLYSLFFFIRDGEKMLKKFMFLMPLGDRYEMLLYKKFVAASNSMIKGTIIIGGVQGLLGGIAFMLAGIDGAILWGIIMILFSLVPGIGAALIWFPAGLIMLALGNIWQGVLILSIGFIIISTIDNLLRPLLVGKDLAMPPLIVLFSSLGGIVVFGASGFMIGPVIASLFLAFWEMYQEYFHRELSKN